MSKRKLRGQDVPLVAKDKQPDAAPPPPPPPPPPSPPPPLPPSAAARPAQIPADRPTMNFIPGVDDKPSPTADRPAMNFIAGIDDMRGKMEQVAGAAAGGTPENSQNASDEAGSPPPSPPPPPPSPAAAQPRRPSQLTTDGNQPLQIKPPKPPKREDPLRMEKRVAELEAMVKSLGRDLADALGKMRQSPHETQDLRTAIDQLRGRLPKRLPFRETFIAQVTDHDEEWHAFKEEFVNGSGVLDHDSGRHVDDPDADQAASEINGWKNVPAGTRVAQFSYLNRGTACYAFALTPPPPPLQDGTKEFYLGYGKTEKGYKWSGPAWLHPVSLTGDDTSTNGDTTHSPSYTYKWPVSRITGAEILNADGSRAASLSPEVPRDVGQFDVATYGEIYINSDGDPVLWKAWETEWTCVEGS